ncbi:hypothetical protein BU15DRAFT_88995 [Melanogaster broomeanus]|nr:hypothetical protein BU15DRAFT_88995 [Melanogaster broomeanus]
MYQLNTAAPAASGVSVPAPGLSIDSWVHAPSKLIGQTLLIITQFTVTVPLKDPMLLCKLFVALWLLDPSFPSSCVVTLPLLRIPLIQRLPLPYANGTNSPAFLTFSRLFVALFSVLSQHVPNIVRKLRGSDGDPTVLHTYAKRSTEPNSAQFIISVCLIPVLVLLSGVFAGLTLGYMSLDETQLNVLSMSGTPQQKRYANKIKPIRQNGHLLLVTLLLANMIVNETLPVISDPVLGGGVQSVVVSTVLIVIFAEIIPQSVCTRHGLYLGAKMAGFTRILIYLLGVVAWPVAKVLEFAPRAELKELIAMHSTISPHGGDLKTDTVTIIGATLDLQEKVVKQAMTPIQSVFMLSIESKLDYETMKKICLTGHSRVPVYEEVEIAIDASGRLEKHRFQEGRSHMAIVSRFSVEKAASVKKVAKRSLTQRLRERVGMGDSSDSSESSDDEEGEDESKSKTKDRKKTSKGITWAGDADGESSIKADAATEHPERTLFTDKGRGRHKQPGRLRQLDVEMAMDKQKIRLPRPTSGLEQSMPADAVLTKKDAEDFLQGIDPTIMPLGIITLEDILEELIGEEIYDEFDSEGANGTISSYVPSESTAKKVPGFEVSPDYTPPVDFITTSPPASSRSVSTSPVLRPLTTRGLNFLRSKSAPPSPRDPQRKTSQNTPAEPSYASDNIPSIVIQKMEAIVSSSTDDLKGAEEQLQDPETTHHTASERTSLPTTPRTAPLKKRALSNVGMASALPGSVSSPSSRSGSPAPSLEAILLDRKRRLTAAAVAGKDTGSVSMPSTPITTESRDAKASMLRVVTPILKGTSKFKSSPLGGGDRTGIVVAEKVKQEMKDQEGVPDETEKAGPGKKQDNDIAYF